MWGQESRRQVLLTWRDARSCACGGRCSERHSACWMLFAHFAHICPSAMGKCALMGQCVRSARTVPAGTRGRGGWGQTGLEMIGAQFKVLEDLDREGAVCRYLEACRQEVDWLVRALCGASLGLAGPCSVRHCACPAPPRAPCPRTCPALCVLHFYHLHLFPSSFFSTLPLTRRLGV